MASNKNMMTSTMQAMEGTEPTVPVLPKVPDYITGNFVAQYMLACSDEVQQRFKDMCARSRITFPATDDALRSEQIELFMRCI